MWWTEHSVVLAELTVTLRLFALDGRFEAGESLPPSESDAKSSFFVAQACFSK
jgi:hypothetical protein